MSIRVILRTLNVGLVHRSYLPDMMSYDVGLPPYKLDMVVVWYKCNTHSGIAFSEHHLAVNNNGTVYIL